MTIMDRILEMRCLALTRAEPIPNVCRLPPPDMVELRVWIHARENDPYLGHVPFLGHRVYGMVYLEDETVSEITLSYEEDFK